jgi:hypothetical protein
MKIHHLADNLITLAQQGRELIEAKESNANIIKETIQGIWKNIDALKKKVDEKEPFIQDKVEIANKLEKLLS